MTNAKRYFAFHVKSNLRALICILAVALILTLLIALAYQPYTRWGYDPELKERIKYYDYKSTLYTPVVFLCILTFILPIMEFSFFKKRTNLDCAYSMPISRRALGCVHYLSGLLTLSTVFTASYLMNFAVMLTRGNGVFHFAPLIAHYLLSLLVGCAIYSIMVFVFNEANSVADGIWFMILYCLIFWFICVSLSWIQIIDDILYGNICTMHWGIIAQLTIHYQYLAEINDASKAVFWQTAGYVMPLILCVIIGIASAIGLYHSFGKRRMEKTEDISDSYFGYRTLIPIYAFSGALWGATDIPLFFGILFAFCAFIGYTIYRRGFHYKRGDVICVIGTLVISIIGLFTS